MKENTNGKKERILNSENNGNSAFCMNVGVRILLEDGALMPVYSSDCAAGADVCAFLPQGRITLNPMDTVLVPTGIKMALPQGWEAQIRPRSGLAAKYGITVLNSPGTIDADYRGEVKVILINLSQNKFEISNGDRIAQLVFAPCAKADFVSSVSLDETKRGTGGFGSTGL